MLAMLTQNVYISNGLPLLITSLGFHVEETGEMVVGELQSKLTANTKCVNVLSPHNFLLVSPEKLGNGYWAVALI